MPKPTTQAESNAALAAAIATNSNLSNKVNKAAAKKPAPKASPDRKD